MALTSEQARKYGKMGGGRPQSKSTLLAQKMREMLTIELHKRFKPIIEAQLDAATGIQTEAYDRKTGKLYYKDPGPDTVAFKTVMEQAIGKPTERVELSSKDGIPLIIRLDV